METIRILLVDDFALIRAGIRLLLEKEPDFEVVGEAANGIEAIELVEKLFPDVVLLDIKMPKMDGVEVAQKLYATGSPVKIIGFSLYDNLDYILGLLAYGAVGYILKDFYHDEIFKAIRAAANGEREIFSAEVARKLKKWKGRSKDSEQAQGISVDPMTDYT